MRPVPEVPSEEGETPSPRYIIGIDLGTTNSAVAFIDRAAGEEAAGRARILEIPQLVAPGEVAARPVLPSFLYLPGPYELAEGSTGLPWDPGRTYVVGEFAREQGGLVPGRLVFSAKSWLCHGGVDRTGRILPWGAAEGIPKVSPVEASARYLQHIREAWNDVMAREDEACRMEEQQVILTVPASFDEVARELTCEAAREAGLGAVVLVEEPLAAFYAWLSRHEQDWEGRVRPGHLVLVCDVGGGTTDFTLVVAREGEHGLRFDRLAVGDHLMLGGDNMDLALARHLEARLAGAKGRLETKRWHQLWHQCRRAKEFLLSAEDQGARMDVVVAGAGGRLIADTLKATLTGDEVRELILEGFFPIVSLGESPREESGARWTEGGLPLVQDPAVTRHLGTFWRRFESLLARETGRDALYPDFVLFNGGALKPPSVRGRILDVIERWFRGSAPDSWAPAELDNPSPELAVALGAAYYGLVRAGQGIRVGAGSPRAYYVRVEDADTSGRQEGSCTAVCVVPRGTEEGFEAELERPAFEVLANQPVSFEVLSSSTRLGDRVGEVVDLGPEEARLLPPIRTVLRYGRKGQAQRLPAGLSVRLTEVGTLELWCRSRVTSHKWRLAFDVRQEEKPGPEPGARLEEILDQALVDQARDRIRAAFSRRPGEPSGPAPERLVKELSAVLRMHREKWSLPLLRSLCDALLEVQGGRALSARHEGRWLNLLGYCLRPGFGDPVDEWRMKEAWKVYLQGLAFPRDVSCRSELWIFLRRVSGGLPSGHQWRVYQELSGYISSARGGKRKRAEGWLPKRLNAQEELEVWMTLASFERLPVETKMELGRILLQRVRRKARLQELWALSRLGARLPLYGPLDRVVPGREVAAWIRELLGSGPAAREAMAHALVHLGRFTGDRERDIPDADRDQVSRWLEQVPGSERFREMLADPEGGMARQEQAWIFGDSLPEGLVLVYR